MQFKSYFYRDSSVWMLWPLDIQQQCQIKSDSSASEQSGRIHPATSRAMEDNTENISLWAVRLN